MQVTAKQLHAERGQLGDLVRHVERGRVEIVVGHDPRHDAMRERLVGRHDPAGERHVSGESVARSLSMVLFMIVFTALWTTAYSVSGRSELAAINFSSHFVVSAKRTELDAIEAGLKNHNVNHQRLPVSIAFHSRWMDKAKAPFEPVMRSIRCKQARLPFVCCDQAAVLSDLPADFFWNVVRRPIRFREATARLEQQGARRYIDVGPAGTLATFLKYGLPATSTSTAHAILTPYGVDQKNLAAVSVSIGH